MLVKYIDASGNQSVLETLVDPKWETKMEKIGNVYFEKKTTESKEVVKVVIEGKAVEVADFDEVAAKEFLKEKGVRGYGLLKGEGLKKKAIAE